MMLKQGVALTGRNRTGPPSSVGSRTAHAPARRRADRASARRPAGPTTGSVTNDRRRRHTTTDDSVQNNTGPLGEPLINLICVIKVVEFERILEYRDLPSSTVRPRLHRGDRAI